MTPDTPFGQACDRVDAGGDVALEAEALVEAMTLDEKLDCLDGDTDFWAGLADMTAGGYHEHPWPAAVIDRLGIPGINFADGPRGCVVGPATCFPVSMARGASFDPDLEERIGAVIGLELRAIGADFTGAVCMNLLRHPGWGRAQETYGEDPHHVGAMAAALTKGLQRHVMACMKHFALNSMENARFTVDVTCDERALHEVYLPHFRHVAEQGVAAVMSAYNSVNGEWAGDNRTLLTDILRDEWGWDGVVITDFIFGLRDPVGSLGAGCNIEMPFRQQRAHTLPDAVANGELAETDVDRAVADILRTLLRFRHAFSPAPSRAVLAAPEHRSLAREAAVASTVLIRNEGALPLDAAALSRVAVLGRLAREPNLGDGGSSNVYPPEVVTPLEGLRAAMVGVAVEHRDDDATIVADADATIVVVGYTKHDEGEFIGSTAPELFALFPPAPEAPAPAVREEREPAARPADGRADDDRSFSRGGDRRSLRLSAEDEALIAEARAASSGPVVVVVMAGSAVVMPWLDTVDAALQLWYPGMEGGHALADCLLGTAEPGGRLPFAVPHEESDLVDFDPDATRATYDLFHGQWHLDRNGTIAHLPFGFGLGYTTFELEGTAVLPGEEQLRVEIANNGDRDGSTVVFVFGALPESRYERPQRRLIGFRKVSLRAGEQTAVEIPIELSALDVRVADGWVAEAGTYEIDVGFHADDLPLRLELRR